MDWAVIIQFMIDMIAKCMENRERADIEAGLQNPGPREAFALYRVFRKQGLRGRELRNAVRDGMDALRAMGPDEISALLEAADEDE